MWYPFSKRLTADFQLPQVISADGISYPVGASFGSLKFIPNPFALAHNRAWPVLRLYEDRMAYRIFRTKEKLFFEIEKIETHFRVNELSYLIGHNLTFYFKNRVGTFGVSLINRNNAVALAEFFKRHGVPIVVK